MVGDKMCERDQEVWSSRYKISHGDVMYSMGSIVNFNVLTLYGDKW